MQGAAVRTSQRHADVRGHTPSASWRRLAATLTLVVVAASGCAGSDSADDAPAGTTQTAPTAVVEPATVRDAIADGAKVIDVRTPEEFASGHLRGAVNVDSSAPDFVELIADLDETATYVVYCASGNRAGTAVQIMRDQGFDDVINGGGFEDLAALGLPTS
ncbi:MAG: rhodanese-like domain-containing protein [Nocardioides sp.]|jgi:rhodanese-related sulfurtransferase